MRELDDNSVVLTVTSPPYFSVVDYGRYAKGARSKYRRSHSRYEHGFTDYHEYLALMQRVLSECYRVTKPGGHLALNACSVIREGRYYPIPFDLCSRAKDLGWVMVHEIVWHKCRSALDRAGSFVQRPYPYRYYPNACSEHVLVFRKPGQRLFEDVDPSRLVAARIPLSPLVTGEIVNNIWHIAPAVPGKVEHPCPFPEDLAHRLIVLYSMPGDVVLDPFNGSGTTTKVAKALGRRCVGYDVEEKFVELAKARLHEPLGVRSNQIVVRYEHITDDPFLRVGRPEQEPPEGDEHSP